MTLAEAGEIFRYWQAHPPVHLLVGALFRPPAGGAGRGEHSAGLPSGLAVGAGALDMPAPTLDLDAMRARNRARAVAIAQRNAAATARGQAG